MKQASKNLNNNLAQQGNHYLIPKHSGKPIALVMAIFMHGLLFLFLWIGIRWQSQTPVGVDAEIWDVTTREAAPVPVVVPEQVKPEPEQPPQPTAKQIQAQLEEQLHQQEAELAIERAKEQKLKDKKLAEEKLQKEQAEKEKKHQEDLAKAKKLEQEQAKTKAAELAAQKKADALAEKQRQDNLRRLTGAVAGSGGNGDAVKSTGNNRVDASYAAKIAAKIKSNMVYVGADNGPNLTVEFTLNLFPDGSLRGSPRKTQSSGVPEFDAAVERAIIKSVPFPADKNGNIAPSLTVPYRLKD